MKRSAVAVALGVSLVAATTCAVALQTASPQSRGSGTASQDGKSETTSEDSPNPPPVIRLEFKTQTTIPGVEAASAIALPILCSGDGELFLSAPQPPDYATQAIFSLNPKGAQEFNYKAIAGIYDVRLGSFFPADAGLNIQVNATSDSKQSPFQKTSQNGDVLRQGMGFSGERHDYIVQFDRNGNYKSRIELPSGMDFHRIAELPDGSFVAVAFDRSNRYARLMVLGSDGQLIRNLQIPGQLEDSSVLRKGATGDELDRGRAETSLSWWLFAPARQRILLYQSRTNAPVLEVGAAGVVREVPVAAPSGYVLDGVISSGDRWIMRYRRSGIPEFGAVDNRPETMNVRIFEVDPNDGSLKTEFEAGAGPGYGIACEQDGVFTGLSMSSDSKYVWMTAEIPR